MQRATIYLGLLTGMTIAQIGCQSRPIAQSDSQRNQPDSPVLAAGLPHRPVERPRNFKYLTVDRAHDALATQAQRSPMVRENSSRLSAAPMMRPAAHERIATVKHEVTQANVQPSPENATLSIGGRSYRLQLIDGDGQATPARHDVADLIATPLAPPPAPTPLSDHGNGGALIDSTPVTPRPTPPNALELNLPTALAMVSGQHPAVGFARWRVQEAYANLDRSRVLWLPSLQPGLGFHKHDGNYQASDGSIIDVHRNSFQYGIGTGATGAGTTPFPGLIARFHLADAIFEPQIAEKTAWAEGHAANAVVNRQLFDVALAYLQLLRAEQELRIVEDSLQRTSELFKLTSDFASTGQGLEADADRLQTELRLVENRLATAEEQVDVASIQLSQQLSMDAGRRIVPLDPLVLPLQLVSLDATRESLISTGLSNRPELKEAQALVAAACQQHERQKYAPFVPSVLLGLSSGGFGGGLGNNLESIDERYDIDALLTWEIRNLGFGESAARREAAAVIQQAKFEQIRILDQVASEVAEAHAQAVQRVKRIEITQGAIQSAENSFSRNLSRIRDGQGLPLEVLQSVRALEDARRAYLQAVVESNAAQFRLQWALGWPVFAPDQQR